MTSEPESFDPDIVDLLQSEKPLEAPPLGAATRVFAAVSARVAAPPTGGGGTGGPDAATGPFAPFGPAFAPSPLRAFAPLAGAFVLGGAIVGTIVAVTLPRERVVIYQDRVVAPSAAPMAPPAATPTIGEAARQGSPIADTVLPPTPSAVPSASAPASLVRGDRLAAERALLDVARNSLANGEPDKALAAVTRHEKEFPHGALAEEREAMAVKTLVMAGRGDEARARGAAFKAHFPNSFMLHAVESSLATIP